LQANSNYKTLTLTVANGILKLPNYDIVNGNNVYWTPEFGLAGR